MRVGGEGRIRRTRQILEIKEVRCNRDVQVHLRRRPLELEIRVGVAAFAFTRQALSCCVASTSLTGG